MQASNIPKQIGAYDVISEIGRGSTSIVYKVAHQTTGKIFALKILNEDAAVVETIKKRFKREWNNQKVLEHENIVKARDYGEGKDGMYLVMDYVEGQSLDDFLKSQTKLPVELAVHLVSQIAKAVNYLHKNDLVHRDIKPSNILVVLSDKKAYLSDLGLLKNFQDEEEESHITKPGDWVGSHAYFSPEQAIGLPVDKRCDIYALGMVLFQLITGILPFNGTDLEIIEGHINKKPPSILDLNPEFPKWLDYAITKATQKDPQARFQNIESFLSILQ